MPDARVGPSPLALPDPPQAPVREEVFFVSINRDRSCLVTSTPHAGLEPGENTVNSRHWGLYSVKLAKRLQSIAPAYPGAPYLQRYVGLVPTLLQGRLTQAKWRAQVLHPLRAAVQAANADVNKRYHLLKHNPYQMRSSFWNWPVRLLVLLIPVFFYHITWDHGLRLPPATHDLPLAKVPRKALGSSWLWIFLAALNVVRSLVGLPIILAGVLLAFIVGFAVDVATLRLVHCCASCERSDAWVADRLSRQPELDSAAIDGRVLAAAARVAADLVALTGLPIECAVQDDDEAGWEDDPLGRSYFRSYFRHGDSHRTKRFLLHGRVPVARAGRRHRSSAAPDATACIQRVSAPVAV